MRHSMGPVFNWLTLFFLGLSDSRKPERRGAPDEAR